MARNRFKPQHIHATAKDIAGNNGIGRYLLLPGSENHAQEIARHFDQVVTKTHTSGHTLLLGTIHHNGLDIDVATIATGMGATSMEIILHELIALGAKRFLRVGTAISLQDYIPVGDLINAQAAVRDESTTESYLPRELPAIASLEFASSIMLAAEKKGLSSQLHTGIVHSTSALYAREFGAGPRTAENAAYLNLLIQSGIVAAEMETSALFIMAQYYNHLLRQAVDSPEHRVLAGAILSVVATPKQYDATESLQRSIEIAIETVRVLAGQELFV